MSGTAQIPASGPWVWSQADIAATDDWVYRLSPAVVAEIEDAVADVKRRGLAFETVTRDDFPLPGFEADAAGVRGRRCPDPRGAA